MGPVAAGQCGRQEAEEPAGRHRRRWADARGRRRRQLRGLCARLVAVAGRVPARPRLSFSGDFDIPVVNGTCSSKRKRATKGLHACGPDVILWAWRSLCGVDAGLSIGAVPCWEAMHAAGWLNVQSPGTCYTVPRCATVQLQTPHTSDSRHGVGRLWRPVGCPIWPPISGGQ